MKQTQLYYCLMRPVFLLIFLFVALGLVGQSDIDNNIIEESNSLSFNFCCPQILSQTIATYPSDLSRTKLGIGEEVMLNLDDPSFSGSVVWQIINGNGMIIPMGITAKFTAGNTAGTTTVRVIMDGSSSCNQEISFTIINPTEIRIGCPPLSERLCIHRFFYPSGGMVIRPYIYPDDVSFYRLEVQEQFVDNSTYESEGIWATAGVPSHSQGEFGEVLDFVKSGLGQKLMY